MSTRTIVDPTADGCPRSPLIYHVPWVLYLHPVLLSKNIFPVPEFVVNPSRSPYRSVANRRRTAQRVQERIQTGRRGVRRPRLSAANVGSDHVNSGHGEYAARDRLLINHFVVGRVYIAHGIFSRDSAATASLSHGPSAFPCRFRRFPSFFCTSRPFFTSPTRVSYLFSDAPQSIITVRTVPLWAPGAPKCPPRGSDDRFLLRESSGRSFLPFFRPFLTFFNFFYCYHSSLIVFFIPNLQFFLIFRGLPIVF